MAWDDDPARLTWMFVHGVVAAVALNPTVSPQPRHDLVPVRLGLSHGDVPMRKYWRIFRFQSINFCSSFAAE
ncbi:MAG: hypothetical protein WBF24_02020 [Xanthobacteraceae bacterium]